MRRHHDGLGRGEGAGEARDDVAGVAADLRARFVDEDLGAQLFTVSLDALGHVALLARDRVDLDEFEQKVLDALLINHASLLGRKVSALQPDKSSQ